MKIELKTVLTVRKGSQRGIKKNFKKFFKKNLLAYKIETLKKVKNIGEIIINTDSEKAIKIAKEYKVKFHMRDPYYASSRCSNSEFWSHIAKVTNSEYILFTHCTNPLVRAETYRKMIKLFMKEKKNYDTFNSVTSVKEFLYLNKKPINFNPNKSPNSQDLPNLVKLNFAINILPTQIMKNKKSLIGKKPFFYELSQEESFDINTPTDFKVAEILFKKKLS